MIILRTKMEIAEQYCRLGASDHQNEEHEEQESKHVVHLAGPQRVQDEKQLDEDASKRQHSSHNDAGNGLRVNRLIGDLAGNLVGANWMFQGLKIKMKLVINFH